jgi:hypothetical protein
MKKLIIPLVLAIVLIADTPKNKQQSRITVSDYLVINADGSISSQGKVLLDASGKIHVSVYTFDEVIATALANKSDTVVQSPCK